MDDAYAVPDPTCTNERILGKITSSDSFFPTLFHLLATASCLYHGWNILGSGAWGGHFHGYKNDGGTRRAFQRLKTQFWYTFTSQGFKHQYVHSRSVCTTFQGNEPTKCDRKISNTKWRKQLPGHNNKTASLYL